MGKFNSAVITPVLAAGSVASPYFFQVNVSQRLCEKSCVESLGGNMSEEPYYNCYALWVTANMLYSDHAQSVAEDMGHTTPAQVPNEKMALSMYKKAVEKLKDKDRPRFVRDYFGV